MADGLFLTFPIKKAKRAEIAGVIYESIILQQDEETGRRCLPGCRALQRMREEVVTVANVSGARASQAAIEANLSYLRGVQFAADRVEIAVNSKFQFLWTDSFTGKESKFSSLELEKLCVLFNLAMLEGSMAISVLREVTFDNLKAARSRFLISAGYLQYIAAKSLSGENFASDLYQDSAEFLRDIMLINALIAFFEAARMKNSKPDTLASLAAAIAQMMGRAKYHLENGPISELEKQHGLSSLLSVWSNYYVCTSHLFQAMHFDATSNMRDRLACLYHAGRLNYEVSQKLGRQKKSAATSPIIQNLQNGTSDLARRISREQKNAEEENDLAEHTSASDVLPEIEPRGMTTEVPTIDTLISEPVPEDVQGSFDCMFKKNFSTVAKSYTAKVTDIIREELGMLDVAGTSLNEARKRYLMDSTISAEEGQKMPTDGLVASAITSGGFRHLQEREQQVVAVSKEAWDMLASIEDALSRESAEDTNARRSTGGKLNRPFSSDLNIPYYGSCTRIRAEMQKASSADENIRSRMMAAREQLQILDKDRKPVDEQHQHGDAEPDSAMQREKSELVSDLGRLMKANMDLIQEFKDTENQEMSNMRDVPDDPLGRETYFERRLKERYDPLRARTSKLCREASDLRRKIEEFGKRQGSSGSTGGGPAVNEQDMQRMAYLQKQAANIWAEVGSNWSQGLEFYNKELHVLRKLQEEIEGFVEARKTELQDHMEQLNSAFQNMGPPSGRNPYGHMDGPPGPPPHYQNMPQHMPPQMPPHQMPPHQMPPHMQQPQQPFPGGPPPQGGPGNYRPPPPGGYPSDPYDPRRQ